MSNCNNIVGMETAEIMLTVRNGVQAKKKKKSNDSEIQYNRDSV